MGRYMGIADAAEDAEVNRRTIQRWISLGLLPAIKLSPSKQGKVRIAREDWLRFLDSRRVCAR